MATIACTFCGSPISFEEDQRGFDVYCPSCGRANAIPAESRVFSEENAARLQQQNLGWQTCLCGNSVTVRLADVGRSVYCPSCGGELHVVAALVHAEPQSLASPDAAAEESPTQPMEPATRRRRSLWVVAAVVGAGVVVGALAPQVPSSLLARWNEFRARFAPDVSLPQPDRPASKTPTGPRTPPVTAKMISRLLTQENPVSALAQARVWQRLLQEQKVAADDPRVAELARVIRVLQARASPKPQPPPPWIAEFQESQQAIVEGLKARNLGRARAALARAQTLFDRHAEDLAPSRARLLALRERVERAGTLGPRAEPIGRRLDEADQAQAAGQVTEALEQQATARLSALLTPLTPMEAALLDQSDRRVAAKIRFARGKRAVEDAQRYVRAGEPAGRDREVRRALALLPGALESEVEPWLERLRPWIKAAQEAADPPEPSGPIAQEIALRDAYEEMLMHFGRSDVAAWQGPAERLPSLLAQEHPQTKVFHARLEALLDEAVRLDPAGPTGKAAQAFRASLPGPSGDR